MSYRNDLDRIFGSAYDSLIGFLKNYLAKVGVEGSPPDADPLKAENPFARSINKSEDCHGEVS